MSGKSAKNEFDVIVIGDSWTGIFLASSLSKKFDVAFVKTTQHNRLFPSSNELPGYFEYFPQKLNSLDKIEWLNNEYNLDLEGTSVPSKPVTIDSGKLVQFLGFGERSGKSIEDLAWYNEENHIRLNKNGREMKDELLQKFRGELFESQEVTDLNVVDGQIEHVEINGQKKLKTKYVIFCEPPNKLLEVISHDFIPNKFRQKVIKIKPLSCLQIIYRHNQSITDSSDLHFLMGNKEDFEPCVGYFWNDKETKEPYSHWMSLIPSDLTEDIEKVGATFKNIKRQIKRAYPDFQKTVEFEKVVVKDQTHGFVDLDFKDFGKIKGLNNLLCASPLLIKDNDLLAAIEVAKIGLAHTDIVSL